MSTETLARKRYIGRKAKVDRRYSRVFACANCETLTDTERAHTITCSTACRVALHRHPERLSHWESQAEFTGVSIQDALDASAAVRLLSDEQVDAVGRGEAKLNDFRAEIYTAYIAQAFEWAREGS